MIKGLVPERLTINLFYHLSHQLKESIKQFVSTVNALTFFSLLCYCPTLLRRSKESISLFQLWNFSYPACCAAETEVAPVPSRLTVIVNFQ